MIYSLLIIIILFFVGFLDAQGDFSVKIVNNTNNINVTKLYVVVKGINPNSGKQCFVAFNANGGVGTCVDITLQTDATTFNYDYKFFKDNTLHLPNLISGRIYVSLNAKLVMPIVVDAIGQLGIADPSPYNTSDPNYYKFFDKIEFTYIGNNTWINPTAVDFFALPMTIEQNGHTYGLNQPRKTINNAVINIFNSAPNKAWKKLIIKNNNGNVLRVLAPGRDDNYFDPLYLTGYPYNYVDDVWNYYRTNSVVVDCSELQGNPNAPRLGNYFFTGNVIGNSFVFTNQTKDYTVTIDKPSSDSFFLGAQGAFDAPNNTPKAIIVRNLSAAWCVGLLPTENGAVLNRNYFNNHQPAFYKVNVRLSSQALNTGPYYNLYGLALHLFSKSIYTWPYDDAFGYDGTNASVATNPVTLTVWDCSAIKI